LSFHLATPRAVRAQASGGQNNENMEKSKIYQRTSFCAHGDARRFRHQQAAAASGVIARMSGRRRDAAQAGGHSHHASFAPHGFFHGAVE